MSPQTPEQLAQAFVNAINERDVDGALALWREDAVIVAADGPPLSGHAQIRPALEAMSANGTTIGIEIEHLYVAGDVAVVAGVLRMTSTGETPFRTQANSTVVYRRGEDGSWRIALDAPWGLPGR